MALERHSLFGRFGRSSPLQKWERALEAPGTLSPVDLTQMGAQMRKMRDDLDHLRAVIHTEMLARGHGNDGIDRPDQCDWAARSGPWHSAVSPRGHIRMASPTEVGGGVKLFHDARDPEMSLRQDPVPGHIDGPLFGLVLEVYRFDGSFLSFVQDLPDDALKGLTLNHFIAVHLTIETEQPLEVYARLNVQHGPNTEQIVRQVEISGTRGVAEFDLAYTKINEKRLEKAWLDLILEGPSMNRVALWDMVMLRAPRADL